MTLSSAYIELFIREEKSGGMSGGKIRNTGANKWPRSEDRSVK